MQVIPNTTRKRRKASACLKRIDSQRNFELLVIPAVRAIVQRSKVSPVTAALFVELSDHSQEGFNG